MAPVVFSIPRPYNGGEWRISKQVTGPRGGKRWERIISQPATGSEYHTDLEPGIYKETYWSNGWPTSHVFELDDTGYMTETDPEMRMDQLEREAQMEAEAL